VYDLAELVSGTAAEDALELVEATDSVGGVAVEGAYLAASSFGSLRVWDIASGALVAQPHVEIDTPPFSIFSPDGTSLLYAETGYEVRRLILDPEELVDQARRRLTRDLTQEECETYLGPGQCGQYET
jgi:hypothetical protein